MPRSAPPTIAPLAPGQSLATYPAPEPANPYVVDAPEYVLTDPLNAAYRRGNQAQQVRDANRWRPVEPVRPPSFDQDRSIERGLPPDTPVTTPDGRPAQGAFSLEERIRQGRDPRMPIEWPAAYEGFDEPGIERPVRIIPSSWMDWWAYPEHVLPLLPEY